MAHVSGSSYREQRKATDYCMGKLSRNMAQYVMELEPTLTLSKVVVRVEFDPTRFSIRKHGRVEEDGRTHHVMGSPAFTSRAGRVSQGLRRR